MDTKHIESLIVELSNDPFNPEINFKCAVEYETLNQTASAVSFYLRCAEYGVTSHTELVYAALLKMAHCFSDQNDRVNTVSNCILQAVSVAPWRPEAYFLMSQFYERQGAWRECYTWASMGLNLKEVTESLPVHVGYEGPYCLEFEKAVSSWWIGRKEESFELFNALKSKQITKEYRQAVEANLANVI